MLNFIIWFQAVVKIISNETARALDILAKQHTKACNAIPKPPSLRLSTVSKGGVCGKFNLSNCCLQIDDEGKVIEEITEE
jgi:hypothetical protein